MTNILNELYKAYEKMVADTLALAHLGLPTARQGGHIDLSKLPKPCLSEPNSQTKYPYILALEYTDPDDNKKLHQLACPCTPYVGRNFTHELVMLGVHPLDIKVIHWAWKTNEFTIRTSVDHLFWTIEQQEDLQDE